MQRFTKLEYQVAFLTPAFLGNAEQAAQWRTPPFKALIRSWWRIVVARDHGYDPSRLLETEKRLFGNASDGKNGGSSQSRVRLRLSSWENGTFQSTNEELKNYKVANGRFEINAGVYLGYGPITLNSSRSAIGPTSSSPSLGLDLIFDRCEPSEIQSVQSAVRLANAFGTLGSRARNAWGSLIIVPKSGSDGDVNEDILRSRRDWTKCMDVDWPHAIGSDERGTLAWHTTEAADWREAVKAVAKVRVLVNRHDYHVQAAAGLKARHLLSYPVTKSEIPALGNNGRIPGQLRMKVVREGSRFRGLIVHVPARIPDALIGDRRLNIPTKDLIALEIELWQQVHQLLDQKITSLTRVF